MKHTVAQRIAAKYPGIVESISHEGETNGTWFNLEPGLCFDDCHTVHEWTAAEAHAAIKRVTTCDCGECGKLSLRSAIALRKLEG